MLCARPYFEPLESVELEIISYKTSLFMTLASTKRVGDLQALSLRPNLAFAPKGQDYALQVSNFELQYFPFCLICF